MGHALSTLAVEQLLADAWEACSEGRLDRALSTAGVALEASEALDDPALIVRSLAIEAEALRLSGDHLGAIPVFARVLSLARGPERRPLDDDTAAQAVATAYRDFVDSARSVTGFPCSQLLEVLDEADAWLRATGHGHWRAGILLERAQILERMGDTEGAVAAAQDALASYRPDVPTYSLGSHRAALAGILLNAGSPTEAEPLYHAIVDDPASNAHDRCAGLVGLADCALARRDLEEAKRSAQAALRLAEPLSRPQLTGALATLVAVFRAAGDHEAARHASARRLEVARHLGSAVALYFAVDDEIDGDVERQDFESARELLDELGEHAAAIDADAGNSAFTDAAEAKRLAVLTGEADAIAEHDVPAARALYERAIEGSGDRPALLAEYATFVAGHGEDLDHAESLFARAVASEPADADALTGYAGFVANHRGDLDGAEELFERALAVAPESVVVLSEYAIFLASTRSEPDRATPVYERAVDAHPRNAGLLRNYAYFLAYDLADPERARPIYERAIAADPGNAMLISDYAVQLGGALDDPDGAEQVHERALAVAFDEVDVIVSYADFLADVRHELDRAEPLYDRALAIAPDHTRALRNYAHFLAYDRREPERARDVYERAVAIEPDDAGLLADVAWLVGNELGDDERAAELYLRAIDAEPGNANAITNYAGLRFAAGDAQEGEELLLRALEVAESYEDERRDVLELEWEFYRAVNGPPEGRARALDAVYALLERGVRTEWKLARNVERAQLGHPQPDLVAQLADALGAGDPPPRERWAP